MKSLNKSDVENYSFKKLAADLQRDLAINDLPSLLRCAGHDISLLLIDLQPLKLKMYQESHKKPHLHVDYGRNNNHVASYQIRPPKCLEGKVRNRKHERQIVDWITQNSRNLFRIWNELQQGNEYKAKRIIVELNGNR